MSPSLDDTPERIPPYIVMQALNEPVEVAAGQFQLAAAGRALGTVNGRLLFRWLPSAGMEFEGSYSGPGPILQVVPEDTTLDIPAKGLCAPVMVTRSSGLFSPGSVRGIFLKGASVGVGAAFDRLRFCLVNFPGYFGQPVRYETGGARRLRRGRLTVASSRFSCIADEIPEVEELRKDADNDSGFVISHVGELSPLQGALDEASGHEALDLLHLFFGFLRGAWSGPVFPQAFAGGQKVWEQLANWNVDEAGKIPTWMPQLSPLDLNALFAGFDELYSNPTWRFPLGRALDWYVQANSRRSESWTKVVLGQVALELLAWVELVEARRLHSRGGFRGLHADGRLRSLLQRLRIPCEVPAHLADLKTLLDRDAFDGPGVITRLRNALVHAGEKGPAPLRRASGVQWMQAGQLALQYLELSILALCGYRGKYARRAWVGWKGDDEALVPWGQAG